MLEIQEFIFFKKITLVSEYFFLIFFCLFYMICIFIWLKEINIIYSIKKNLILIYMVNLSKLTKAELQSTGFKNTSTARNDLKDVLKQKPKKLKR